MYNKESLDQIEESNFLGVLLDLVWDWTEMAEKKVSKKWTTYILSEMKNGLTTA